MTRILELRDGRRIACDQTGDLAGAPVFLFHGLPGSRLQQHPDPGLANARHLRMLHLDRPGFGRSTPAPARTLATWARDVAEVADQFDIATFSVVGVSGGGPFALACACELGTRIRRAAVVSSVGPREAMRAGKPDAFTRFVFATARACPALLLAGMNAFLPVVRARPERLIDFMARGLSPLDRAVLARPAMRAMLARDMLESLRQGPAALVRDLRLETRPWQLNLRQIRSPVLLWHGLDDRLIPPVATRAIATGIRHAEVRYFEGEGHFILYEHWASLLEWLAR